MAKKKSVGEFKYDPKRDMRQPRMFADEDAQQRIAKATKISDLKNLGVTSEMAFARAGIKTVQKFEKLGWKKTVEALVKVDKKNMHTLFTYAIYGALTNQEWNGLSGQDKSEIKVFMTELREKLNKKKRKATKAPKKQTRS